MILKISLRAKAGVPKVLVKRKLRLHSLYFPQNTLMSTESRGEFSDLHFISRLRALRYCNELYESCRAVHRIYIHWSNIYVKDVNDQRFNQSYHDTRSFCHRTTAPIECFQAPPLLSDSLGTCLQVNLQPKAKKKQTALL